MSDYDKDARDLADANYAKLLADPKYTRISDDEILQQLDAKLLGGALKATPPEEMQRRFENIAAMPPGELERRQKEAFDAANFNKNVDTVSLHIAKYGADWADRIVAEADRMMEEAGRKRQQLVGLADKIRNMGAEAQGILKEQFETIRAIGRRATDAGNEFNKR